LEAEKGKKERQSESNNNCGINSGKDRGAVGRRSEASGAMQLRPWQLAGDAFAHI
jgi:hypothetical protein